MRHCRPTITSSSSRLWTAGNGNSLLHNRGPDSVITLIDGDLSETRATGWYWIAVRQSHPDATIAGTGAISVDALHDGSAYGHLTGTLKAEGGTLTLKNWTGIYPGGNATTYHTYADTLTVNQDGQLIADGGTLVTENFTAPLQMNGKLGLVNGGVLQVNTVGLTVGSTGYIANNAGRIEIAGGDLLLNSTQASLFDATGTELLFTGATDQHLGLASANLGSADSAFADNFAFGLLTVGGADSASLQLVTGSGEALYLYGLDFDSGMTLDLNGHDVFVKGALTLPDGSSFSAPYGSPVVFVDGDLEVLLFGAGSITLLYVPEPSSLSLLALALVCANALQRRRKSREGTAA